MKSRILVGVGTFSVLAVGLVLGLVCVFEVVKRQQMSDWDKLMEQRVMERDEQFVAKGLYPTPSR
jgi:membrane-associated phospholipid phosphatase